MELHRGKRVQHWKSWWRAGEVIQWYTKGREAGKMWVFFDDGEVELRWITAFVVEKEWDWIADDNDNDKRRQLRKCWWDWIADDITKSHYISRISEHAKQKRIEDYKAHKKMLN
jgi:hypothetical protein